MKTLLMSAMLAIACSALPAESVKFNDTPVGSLPQGWLGTKTGDGKPVWSIQPDRDAPSPPNVLLQSGEATFPVCLKTDVKLTDGYVEVKFKPISGDEDQAGGIVWRAQDADNYYVVRANALENNVHIYHTIRGRRVQFDGKDVEVRHGIWHTLRVEFKGPAFRVFLDGALVLVTQDALIKAAGMVGVWTKADSVTAFDDFSYGER